MGKTREKAFVGKTADRERAAPGRGAGGAAHPALALQNAVGNRGAAAFIQRKCAACGGSGGACPGCADETKLLQRSADGSSSARAPRTNPLAGHGSGAPLGRGVRGFMEGRFGRDFGGVRVHADTSAASAARSLNAAAFTHGRDVYFGRGAYEPDTPAGLRLLAHELTHTVQQEGGSTGGAVQGFALDGGTSDPLEHEADRAADAVVSGRAPPAISPASAGAVQRFPSWDDVKQAGADLAGKAGDTADWVGDKAGKAADWVGDKAGRAADWVGEKYDQAADAVQVDLQFPQVTLFDRIGESHGWSDSTGNVPLYTRVVDIPYIGPTVFEIYGRGNLSLTLGAGLGPGVLRDVVVHLDPLRGHYAGKARLTIPAELTASLIGTGTLGVDANWMCLADVVRLEGGLAVTGEGGADVTFNEAVDVIYKNGEFSLTHTPTFTPCVSLTTGLDALASVSIFEYPVWSGRWDVADRTWEKCWTGSSEYKGGGGSSGGGGASGTYALIAGFPPIPAFSAANVITRSFGPEQPKVITPDFPFKAIEDSGKENPCEVAGGTYPTGNSRSDPIEMTWFKPIGVYPGRVRLDTGFYPIHPPKELFGEGLDIGVEAWYFPGEGKVLMKSLPGGTVGSTRFKRLLERHGYDWARAGTEPDHVQDRAWGGSDDFENLWPLDAVYNRDAGRRQNQNQPVEFCRTAGCTTPDHARIDDRYFIGKWFVIKQVERL